MVASVDGVIATGRSGDTDVYSEKNIECLATLCLPYYEGAKFVPFAAKTFKDLSFKEFFFDINVGLRNAEQRKQVKAVLLFVSGDCSRMDDPNFIRHRTILELRRDFYETFQYQTCIVGTTVTFAKHDIKLREEQARPAYDENNDVKGLVFAGKQMEVKCTVIDR